VNLSVAQRSPDYTRNTVSWRDGHRKGIKYIVVRKVTVMRPLAKIYKEQWVRNKCRRYRREGAGFSLASRILDGRNLKGFL